MISAPLRRRLIGGAVVAGVGLISAELLSFCALWWLEGRPLVSRSLEAARARLIAAAAERVPEATPNERREPAAPETGPRNGWVNLLDDPAHARRQLHPYLGYVYDPAFNQSASRRQSGYPEISPEGFYVVPNPAPAGSGPVLTVAVFGGSMAMVTALEGREALVRELEASRALRGRHVVLRCYALGGYKQPQQLLAFTYLLSLGEKPDLVINLDGLNEVALPYIENRPRGVFPFFPRSWDALAQEVSNPAALERAGLVAHLRARRARLAHLFSAPLLRHSSAWNLLWKSLDNRLEREIAERHLALASLASGAPTFAATGPPRSYASEGELFADLVRSWQRSSLLMSKLAAANGVRYFHFLQPNQFDPGAKPIGRAEAARAADPASSFRWPVLQGYPLLSQAGRDLRRAGVRFFDLRSLFSKVEAPLYIDQCCHVNRDGSALLGEAMGRAVRLDLDAAPAGGPPPIGNNR